MSMLSIRYSISYHLFQKCLQYRSYLIVHEVANTLDTATSSQSPDSRLSYSTNIITQLDSKSFSTSFTEALATLPSTSTALLVSNFRHQWMFNCSRNNDTSNNYSVTLWQAVFVVGSCWLKGNSPPVY
eukprot:GHVS01082435.1.p1 GENE.GHVS01082435.1~~GHVS01082435.1.p1  ORF type:complete len:128 (+),score=12.37 GHVS01082435.1:571-954(+)